MCFAKCLLGSVFVGVSPEHARELGGWRGRELGDLGRGSLDEPHELGAQFIERRHCRERLDAGRIQGGRAHSAAEDDELVVRLTVVPPTGAGLLRVIVPVDEFPPTTLAGFTVTLWRSAGSTVSVADWVELPSVLVIVT